MSTGTLNISAQTNTIPTDEPFVEPIVVDPPEEQPATNNNQNSEPTEIPDSFDIQNESDLVIPNVEPVIPPPVNPVIESERADLSFSTIAGTAIVIGIMLFIFNTEKKKEGKEL